MSKNSEEISAEVILTSRSGRSLTDADAVVTAETLEEFEPAPETIVKATACFQQLGFTVVHTGVTLTILGRKELFEDVFTVQLTLKKDEKTGSIIVHCKGDITIPKSLKNIVEDVVFPEPPEFFL
jgi:hypothetical protein